MTAQSLQTWLESLGLSRIKEGLGNLGITTPKDLVMLRESHLETLTKGLKLDGMSELKFVVAINKLQIQDTRVVMTPQEDEAIRKLTKRINEARVSLNGLQNLFEKTKTCAKKSLTSVNMEFDAIFKDLTKRKAALLNTIEKEEKATLGTLEVQIRKLTGFVSQLREVKRECDKYLMISSLDALDNRTKKFGEQVTDAINLKPPENPRILAEIQYVSDAEKFSKILRSHGKVIKGSLPAIPAIKSHKSTPNTITLTLEDQQKLAPEGESDLKEQHELVDYCVIVSQSEQKQEEGAQRDTFEKLFKADNTTFVLKDLLRKTEYLIQIKAKNRIGWSQPSEHVSIQTTAARQIQGVTIHSYRKSRSNYHPNHLLSSDDNYYASSLNSEFSSGEVDWIVFELKDINQLELVKLRNYNGGQCVKDMNIKCSQDLSNWSDVASVTVANHKDMQEFAVVCSSQYIKLELVNNHGQTLAGYCKFGMLEVQFWGH